MKASLIAFVVLSLVATLSLAQEFSTFRDYSHSAIRPTRYAVKSHHHDISEYLSSRQQMMMKQRNSNAMNSQSSYTNSLTINSWQPPKSVNKASVNERTPLVNERTTLLRGSRRLEEEVEIIENENENEVLVKESSVNVSQEDGDFAHIASTTIATTVKDLYNHMVSSAASMMSNAAVKVAAIAHR